MSLLTCIQAAVSESGFGTAPVSVFGNTDALTVQCLALANRAGQVISTAHNWQNMIQPGTITTVSGQETYDGPFTTAGTGSLFRILGDTFWDSTNFLPVNGSISAQEWQTLKYGLGGTLSLGNRRFRVAYDSAASHGFTMYPKIHVVPTPAVNGEVLVYEYFNPGWVVAVNYGGAAVGTFLSDNDLTLFPEHLLQLSLVWRLRRAKGFDYSEEYNEYKEALSLAIARDSPAPMLNFSYMPAVAWPVNIPQTIPVP